MCNSISSRKPDSVVLHLIDENTARRGYLKNRKSGQPIKVFGTGFSIGCAHGVFLDIETK